VVRADWVVGRTNQNPDHQNPVFEEMESHYQQIFSEFRTMLPSVSNENHD